MSNDVVAKDIHILLNHRAQILAQLLTVLDEVRIDVVLKSTYSIIVLDKTSTSGLLHHVKHMLTVAIETTYDQQEAMLAIYDERTAYEDIREMNIVSTEFKVYMPEMDDVGTSVLHFYLDGEEITSQEVRLERIPVITEERA